MESIGTEVVKTDTQETAQKLVDNVDELEQTISALDQKYKDLMTCEKELEKVEEEIDKQIKEMSKYDILHAFQCLFKCSVKVLSLSYYYILSYDIIKPYYGNTEFHQDIIFQRL